MFLETIDKRRYKKLEEGIFAIEVTRRTRYIRDTFQRCPDMNQDVFAYYIDFQKAFDNILITKGNDGKIDE